MWGYDPHAQLSLGAIGLSYSSGSRDDLESAIRSIEANWQAWWSLVQRWLEIFTGHIPTRRDPLVLGASRSVWIQNVLAIERLQQHPCVDVTVGEPVVLVSEERLREALDLAAQDREPPLAWELIRRTEHSNLTTLDGSLPKPARRRRWLSPN